MKFKVALTEERRYEVEVEAENEDIARDIAMEMANSQSDALEYVDTINLTVEEVEEV